MHATTFISVLFLATLPLASQTADARPHIAKEADLPRFSYPVNGTTEELLTEPAPQFLAFAGKVRADLDRIEAANQIDDHATQRRILETRLNVDLIEGGHDREALLLIPQIRALEDKPAEKLTGQLPLEVFLQARLADGGAVQDNACPRAEPSMYAERLHALPWQTVSPAVKESRMRFQVVSQGFLVGMTDSLVGPTLQQQHALPLRDAQTVIGMRALLMTMVPCKAVALSALDAYVAEHRVAKPDIFAAREAVLPDAKQLTPVRVAIWDSGIDLQLFPGRLYTNPAPRADEDPHGIAFDVHDDRTHGSLIPLTPEQQRDYPNLVKTMEGLGDLQNGIDSPAADTLKAQMASMPAAQGRTFFDTLDVISAYAHGTHVTGIAARNNPVIQLAYSRMTYDSGNPHLAPSEEHSRKSAESFTESVAWFKAHGIRVVNMSWWDRPSNFEHDLASNGIGKDAAERKAMARHLFGIERDALFAAIGSAPEVLFVTIAGNNDADNAFEECIPSSFVLPNLIVTGAVDQAGDETSFTSYGNNVAVDANGFAVPSVVPGGSVVRDTGTSMAAPQVTNLAAKLLAIDPLLTPPQVIALIRQGATASADGRRHLIDPARSLQLLQQQKGTTATARSTAAH
ncbi:S8 family serine peptidase [Terriglobus sp.]|uniref:S8 family serine peptidase n=1 Tax=Terriglobus sp. TaxID=1889013 RepID=UPI003AFFDBF2